MSLSYTRTEYGPPPLRFKRKNAAVLIRALNSAAILQSRIATPGMTAEFFKRLPKVSPNSMLARVLLAFLATAGFFYVNIMPALVDGLKVGLGFSNKQAGLVGSCNVYGAACGAFLIAFLIRRINWRSAAHLCLFGLIAMDLVSMLLKNPFALMGARFLHGFIGGMLVGISFSIFARTTAPDRTFGVLLLVQVFAGGLGVMSLPLLVPKFGTSILFVTLIVFSLTTLVMLQFLPDYPVKTAAPRTPGAAPDKLQLKPLLLALFSVFFSRLATWDSSPSSSVSASNMASMSRLSAKPWALPTGLRRSAP